MAFQPGYDPRRYIHPTSAVDVPAAAPPPPPGPPTEKQLRDPVESVASARRILQRRAPSAARRVTQLIETIDREAPACPACGRGSRRDEELTLKAAREILDRAGVTVPKGADAGEVGAPAIVFPPGTRIAIAVDGLPSADVRQVSRVLPVATRADLLDEPSESRAVSSEDRA